MTEDQVSYRFSGKVFTPRDVALIREVVETCAGVSRKEFANTIGCGSFAFTDPACVYALLPLTRNRANLDRRPWSDRAYVVARRAFCASSASRFRYDSPSIEMISA